MRVADADDSVPAIEVEVLLSFLVPNLAALSLYDIDIEEGIYVE
jgi:hypothetical protein